ncbi:hypothetical protein TNCV_967081 [Trichonephila clavipes]|uniref:Uncharacterized protein n=1 Tax=Trichonephila inaurata madagascariensis TaxID=2747483 RepID=A0A8X6MCL5_9ARAC|nr:hypothetical protein TNIN_404511 [Trichonephila inaurata madagascariensis]GFU94138.1 hypothetical protein TNCV_967081 [Trichonephila clavipes]
MQSRGQQLPADFIKSLTSTRRRHISPICLDFPAEISDNEVIPAFRYRANIRKLYNYDVSLTPHFVPCGTTAPFSLY